VILVSVVAGMNEQACILLFMMFAVCMCIVSYFRCLHITASALVAVCFVHTFSLLDLFYVVTLPASITDHSGARSFCFGNKTPTLLRGASQLLCPGE